MNYKIGLSEAEVEKMLKDKVDIDDSLAKAIAEVIRENNDRLVKDIPKFLGDYNKWEARKRGTII